MVRREKRLEVGGERGRQKILGNALQFHLICRKTIKAWKLCFIS